MTGWIGFLKSDKPTFVYIVLFCLFLLISLIFIPYYDDKIGSILTTFISIIVSIITAVIVVYFTIYKNQFFERKTIISALFDEIKGNKEKLERFSDECELLKNEWIKGHHPRWLPKEPQTGNCSTFFWRYLSLNIYPIIISRGYHIEINHFKLEMFTLLGNYFIISNQFCDKIQLLELKGNAFALILERIIINNGNDISDYRFEYNGLNRFVSTDIPHNYSKNECLHSINAVIDEMNIIKNEFLDEYVKGFSHIYTNSRDRFVESVLNGGNVESSGLWRFFGNNCLYYALISAFLICFTIYSFVKVNQAYLNDLMTFVSNFWYWGFVTIFTTLVIYFILHSIIKKG